MVEILFWGAGGIVFSKDEGEGGTEIVLCALLQRVLPSTLTEFLPWDSARKDDQLSLKWRVQILRLMMNNRVIYVHIGRFIEKTSSEAEFHIFEVMPWNWNENQFQLKHVWKLFIILLNM